MLRLSFGIVCIMKGEGERRGGTEKEDEGMDG